jgi:citrate lyase subunit beta/citryl-CoA lyase
MRVFRSILFAPGSHPRRVEKCLTLGADAVILDLEDAVANAEKVATRAIVVEPLSRSRRCRGYVRVSSLDTQWSHGDFAAVVAKGVNGIVQPKVESAADLQTGEWPLGALEREHELPEGSVIASGPPERVLDAYF